MNGYEVIKTACKFSENDDIADKLTEDNISNFEEVFSSREKKIINMYLDCLNFVQDELITEFRPLFATDTLKSENFKINLSNFSKPVNEIYSIKDLKGRNVKFKIFSSYILVFSNEVVVLYSYKPEKATLASQLEVNIPERIIAYGVAREYYLRQGLTDEAFIYENRFKDSLKVILRKKSKTVLPVRRWN